MLALSDCGKNTWNCMNCHLEEINFLNYEKSVAPEITNNLALISALYIYTGTPPHGYGTQAPKVAETVGRAYSFNKKPIQERKVTYDDIFEIEKLHWSYKDGPFPFDDIHGNFIPSEVLTMIEN